MLYVMYHKTMRIMSSELPDQLDRVYDLRLVLAGVHRSYLRDNINGILEYFYICRMFWPREILDMSWTGMKPVAQP